MSADEDEDARTKQQNNSGNRLQEETKVAESATDESGPNLLRPMPPWIMRKFKNIKIGTESGSRTWQLDSHGRDDVKRGTRTSTQVWTPRVCLQPKASFT
jgi:hypothetical protein